MKKNQGTGTGYRIPEMELPHEIKPSGIITRKRYSTLEEERLVPLIRFFHSKSIEHMIKPEDIDFFENVANYVIGRMGGQVYLGGSAVENWIFKGKKDYKDIDLIADVGENKTTLDFLRTSQGMNKVTTLDLGNGQFCYVKDTAKTLYQNFYDGDPSKMGPTFRFVQIPKMDELDITITQKPKIKRPTPIEVSFFTGHDLEGTIRELQNYDARKIKGVKQ